MTAGPSTRTGACVGPFEWQPNVNAYGHDCMLMVVTVTSDPSNVDNFTAGEVIPEWRLVPNDNNGVEGRLRWHADDALPSGQPRAA